MPKKKSKKPLELYFHKETNIPNGSVGDYDVSDDHAAFLRRATRNKERTEALIAYYKQLEKIEVPVWYDVMQFCDKRPATAPKPTYSDWEYYHGSRPKFYIESIDSDSIYYGKWFRVLSSELRKIVCGKNGASISNGRIGGYWTFTRSGSAVGIRYLGTENPLYM